MIPATALTLASLTSQLTAWIGRHGAYAVFAVMAVDALLPAAGELTMLYAGALAAGAIAGAHPVLFGHAVPTGLQGYVVMALSGTLGYLLGSVAGWAVGRSGGRSLLERHGRWLHLSPQSLERAESWFARYGAWAVFLGRLTPVVRSFISIPAGALGSPIGPYTVLTLAGSAIWCFGFAGAGWALGSNYHTLDHAFTVLEVVLVAGIVMAAVVWLVRRRRRARPR